MKDSHLWENVTIEENACVSQSILCSDCVIKKGAIIPKGCIIGRGCVIGENISLPEYTRISLHRNKETDEFDDDLCGEEEDEDEEELETINEDDLDAIEAEESSVDSDRDHSVQGVEFSIGVTEPSPADHDLVGFDGLGYLWIPGDDDVDFTDEDMQVEDEDDNLHCDGSSEAKHPYLKVIPVRVFERIKQQSIGYDPGDLLRKRFTLQEDGDEGYMFDDYGLNDHGSHGEYDDLEGGMNSSRVTSSSNLASDAALITGRQRGVDVIKELKLICLEHDTSSPIENLTIELNSFKFSQNATFGDCVTGATLAVLERINITKTMTTSKFVSSFKSELIHWGKLFKKLCHSLEEERCVIVAIEGAAVAGGATGDVLSSEPAFRFALQILYDEDIISDDAILSWAERRREEDSQTSRGKLFHQKHTQDFIAWLEDIANDDSDDDSNEDD